MAIDKLVEEKRIKSNFICNVLIKDHLPRILLRILYYVHFRISHSLLFTSALDFSWVDYYQGAQCTTRVCKAFALFVGFFTGNWTSPTLWYELLALPTWIYIYILISENKYFTSEPTDRTRGEFFRRRKIKNS